METIRRSMFARVTLILFLILLGCAGIYFALIKIAPENLKPFAPVAFAIFFAATLFVLFFTVFKPLSIVFREMKALFTGHQYKKIFTARVDEIGVLAHFFNEVTKNLERVAASVSENKRMSEEMSVGADIQRKIVPHQMPEIPGVKIFGNTMPASEVGGDSFDIIPAGENAFIYAGDVTGHGLPAALIMVMVNTMIRTFSEIYKNGYDIIVNTNRILKSRIEPRRFMTCVLLRWNSPTQKMFFTGAGHEHIMIFRKNERVCEVRQTGGIALGMVLDVSRIVREEEIPFSAGDCVVLYSDGIIEAKNMQGEMFGLARLKAAIEKYAGENMLPDDIFKSITREFAEFVHEQTQEDDITLIVIKRI